MEDTALVDTAPLATGRADTVPARMGRARTDQADMVGQRIPDTAAESTALVCLEQVPTGPVA